MRERPILFSAPMVLAILAGRKTQTRRLVKAPKFLDNLADVQAFSQNTHYPECWHLSVGCPLAARGQPCPDDPILPHGHIGSLNCPYGKPGDRLWVRETHHLTNAGEVVYRADYPANAISRGMENIPEAGAVRWKPSIFMRRSESRLTLEVESVRVERLQDISEEDAKAEGVEGLTVQTGPETLVGRPWATEFRRLWDSINGDRANWASNPWVWVVGFKRVSSEGVAG